jgi:hypothetical protein
MRHTRMRIGASVVSLTCAVAGASALTTVPASAASRGFTVTNNSSQTLTLESVKQVKTYRCNANLTCVEVPVDMAFEGRPADGSVLQPGKSQRFELKYGFSFTGGVQYAAMLGYKIGATGSHVEYTIETYSTTNESSCKVTPNAGSCTAQGVDLAFK